MERKELQQPATTTTRTTAKVLAIGIVGCVLTALFAALMMGAGFILGRWCKTPVDVFNGPYGTLIEFIDGTEYFYEP